MQMTFADRVIAQESLEGGFDAVTGFIPTRKSNVQWMEGLQLAEALPRARYNRKRTLAGQIVRCYATELAAAQAVLMYLDDLPDDGPLVLFAYGATTTFARAVLNDVSATRLGITVFAKLSFAVGPGIISDVPIVTPDTGLILETEDGKIITN